MNSRRILIFSLSYYPSFVAGAEVAVKEITARIPPTEMQFEMITLGDGKSPKEEMIGNVKVRRIFRSNGWPQKLMYPFAAYLKGRSLVRKYRYAETWAIMASYAGFAAFLLKKSVPNLPFILTIQEGEHFTRRKGIWRPLFMKIFRSADRITSISNYLADWSRGMGATCPIDIIPNAVDVDLFTGEVPAEEIADLKKKLLKKEDESFIITTSRLVEKNAVENIIEALQYLPKSVKLLILGEGPLETSLKNLCFRLGLNYMDGSQVNAQNRVYFLGYIPHREMRKYLAVSEVFVRPSLTEGLGNSFLEAMAASVPVIATPVGGIPDFLKDGETGLFCEVKNPKSIAQKIEKYLKDAESRAFIVKRARKMVVDIYNWDKIAGDMQQALLKA